MSAREKSVGLLMGTLGFGSIEGFEVNVLWLCVTFPWHDDVGGSQKGSFSCP